MSDGNFIDQLIAICGAAHVQHGDDIEARYQRDWLGISKSEPYVVVRPDCTEDVAAIMRLCAAHKTPVIPMGGNSNLTKATVAKASDNILILSLERMNQVRTVSTDGQYMVAEAGCIIENLHKTADQAGLMFPLIFGAKGTAQIGGALGTNAGGLNVIRYGNARALCLGLEVVTAQGEVMDLLPALKKDNTGYDLVNMMIGSEGTLGIITAASLKLVARPAAYATAMVVVEDASKALQLMNFMQDRTGGRIEAFELFGQLLYDLCVTHLEYITPPFSYSPALSVLVEVAAGSKADATADATGKTVLATELEEILGEAFEAEMVVDAVIAQSESQRNNFWKMREDALEAMQRHGNWVMSDVSFQVSDLPGAIADLEAAFAAVAPGPFCVAFGHMGDGNLHSCARPYDKDPSECPDEAAAIKQALHDTVVKWRGSISAEHGIGTDKQAVMKALKDPVAYAMMKQIKAALDPDNLLNPGKVLM